MLFQNSCVVPLGITAIVNFLAPLGAAVLLVQLALLINAKRIKKIFRMYIPVLEFIPLFSCFLGASSASQRLKNVRLIFTFESTQLERQLDYPVRPFLR